MSGPDWSSTAIFLVWDDWGGFYDNVAPPTDHGNGYGLRVPGPVIRFAAGQPGGRLRLQRDSTRRRPALHHASDRLALTAVQKVVRSSRVQPSAIES
jgi:phospholipase C